MKKKCTQCYLLLGSFIVLLTSCLCSFIFVKGNLAQAARKNSFESIYENTTIDFIVPGPSRSQVEELENTEGNGIKTVTPYYETNTPIEIQGESFSGTTIIFPFADKMEYTPYCSSRITSGVTHIQGGDAVVDQAYIDKHGCSIGDGVSIRIGESVYAFKITSITEANSFYNNGTIALILTEDEAHQFEKDSMVYSSAYITANDLEACKSYLYSEYKPLSRLKDRSEFDSDEIFNQHVQNFNEADWSREITNCQENYDALSIKYENTQTGIWTNIIIMAIIVVIVIVVFNTILLANNSIKKFMKAFLVKKSGTKDAIKAFYKSGITANMIVFCISFITLFVYLAKQENISLLDFQVINCVFPTLMAIISSLVMIVISDRYVEKHYRIRVVKKKDATEETHIEVI